MNRISIHDVYEEAEYSEPTGWIVEDEDKRIYQAEHFGMRNDAWATVATASLAEHHELPKILRGFFVRQSTPAILGISLQLRVCSPTFQERDRRFLRDGRHLALVQDEFDLAAVKIYMDKVVKETAHLDFPSQYEAWSRYFHVYDLDDE